MNSFKACVFVCVCVCVCARACVCDKQINADYVFILIDIDLAVLGIDFKSMYIDIIFIWETSNEVSGDRIKTLCLKTGNYQLNSILLDCTKWGKKW